MTTLDQVLAAIRGHRFRYTNEDELQEGIAAALERVGLDPRREVRLGDRDRIDIVVEDVGIEVKVAGAASSAYTQLQRYASHDEISHLVLVTTRWQRLPAEAGGKPLTTISLAGAGL
jgi:hypothetical protein